MARHVERDIVIDPAIPLQQAVFNLYGSEKKTCVEYKSQVLTSRIAKGSPILVVVSRLVDKKRGKVGEWRVFDVVGHVDAGRRGYKTVRSSF